MHRITQHFFAMLNVLVIKEFEYSTNPENGKYVRIVGRQSGLFNWFLSLLGFDSTTTFEVYRDYLHYATSSRLLKGKTTTMTPIHAVTNMSSGYSEKSVIFLILGILTLPIGVGLILIIYYFLGDSLVISITDQSGCVTAIACKPSIIAGVPIGPKDVGRVVGIIYKLILISNPKT